MAFVKQLQNQNKSCIIKARLDENIKTIIHRILKQKWELHSTEDQIDQMCLIAPEKPSAYFIEEITEIESLKKYLEQNKCFILAEWNRKIDLDIDEININRLNDNVTSMNAVNEWISFLGYNHKINKELWNRIHRTNFSIFQDIEKTLVAFNEITEQNFKQVTETSIADTNISELLTAVLISDTKRTFEILTQAWNSGLEIEKTIAYFTSKLDTFMYYYSAGIDLQTSLDKAQISGTIKDIIEKLIVKINKQLPTRIYEVLHKNQNIRDEKIKDILILSDLIAGV